MLRLPLNMRQNHLKNCRLLGILARPHVNMRHCGNCGRADCLCAIQNDKCGRVNRLCGGVDCLCGRVDRLCGRVNDHCAMVDCQCAIQNIDCGM